MNGRKITDVFNEDLTPPSESIETPKGTVNVGDKIVALGNEYVINLIQQGHLFSKDEKGKKLAIKPELIEEIIPQEKG